MGWSSVTETLPKFYRVFMTCLLYQLYHAHSAQGRKANAKQEGERGRNDQPEISNRQSPLSPVRGLQRGICYIALNLSDKGRLIRKRRRSTENFRCLHERIHFSLAQWHEKVWEEFRIFDPETCAMTTQLSKEERCLSPELAFVLQFHESESKGHSFEGRVEHVASGQAIHFSSQQELLSFISRLLQETSKSIQEES